MSPTHDSLDGDWVELLAPNRLESFLCETLGRHETLSVTGRALSGSSNITAFADFGVERFVVRRPPRGDLLPTSHDMMREAKFLQALQASPVPVPRLRAFSDDPTIMGAPFHVTDYVDGLVLQQEEPMHLRDPASLRALCEVVLDTLAAIHAFDWTHHDLPGRRNGYLERQVARWSEQLRLTPSARRLTGVDAITQWIAERIPPEGETTIVHGDFGLHNIILDRRLPRVLAVLDWEMATLGDPLADLFWFLQGWGIFQEGAGNPANYLTTWPGSPTRDEMLERYSRKTGRQLENELFYRLFSIWKGIVVTEGLYSSYLNGDAANPAVARFESEIPARVEHARELLC